MGRQLASARSARAEIDALQRQIGKDQYNVGDDDEGVEAGESGSI
jgi:hypothetical protein